MAKLDLDSFMEGGSPSLLDYKRADEKKYGARIEGGGRRALERELRKGAEFTAWFFVFAAAAFLLLSLPFISSALAGIAAAQSSFFLTLSGTQNSIQWLNGVPHLIVENGVDAEIAELCWGKIEFAVLAGLIAASFDRRVWQRVWGIALGFAVFALFFNPARITLSIQSGSAIVHDVLFRVTLVAAIAFYYFLWYLWTGRKRSAAYAGFD